MPDITRRVGISVTEPGAVLFWQKFVVRLREEARWLFEFSLARRTFGGRDMPALPVAFFSTSGLRHCYKG